MDRNERLTTGRAPIPATFTRRASLGDGRRPSGPVGRGSVMAPMDGGRKSREQMIAERAREIWFAEGRPSGRHETHWIIASVEIDSELRGADD